MTSLSPIKAIKRVATCSMMKSSTIPSLTSVMAITADSSSFTGADRTTRNVAPPPPPPIKRQVSFGKVQIREFAPTIGDQPFVSTGVPIALGNIKVREVNDVPIDTYEFLRQPLRRSNSRQLIIKPNVRAAMLLSQGFQKQEINDAALAAHEAKHNILHSAHGKRWDPFHEKIESTTRALTTLTRRPLLRRQNSSFSE